MWRNFAIVALLLGGSAHAASLSNTGQILFNSYYVAVASSAATSCTVSDTGNTGCAASVSGDCGVLIQFTSSTPVTVTLPSTLPAGCSVGLQQTTTGGTVTVNSSMTAHSYLGMTHTIGQYAIIGAMILTAASQYTVYGQGQ